MPVLTATHLAPVSTESAEHAALTSLMSTQEAPVSGAPTYAPQAAGKLLLLVLLSPKEPSEPRDK